MKRAIIMVLDSLGIGALPDVHLDATESVDDSLERLEVGYDIVVYFEPCRVFDDLFR